MCIEMSDLLKENVIVVFYNEERQKFVIKFGKSVSHILMRLVEPGQKSMGDEELKSDILLNNVKFTILETDTHNDLKAIEKYNNEWLCKNYNNYVLSKNDFIERDNKVYTDIVEFNSRMYFSLFRRTPAKKVLGLFSSKKVLDDFKRKWYPNDVITEEVYADNPITRQYVEIYGYKVKEQFYVNTSLPKYTF